MASILALCLSACRSRPAPIAVAVAFNNSWKLGTDTLDESDRLLIRRTVLETLRIAYKGFDVRFSEASAGARLIRVEDTPYVSDPRQLVSFGAAGVTYPASPVSSVRADVLFIAELAAVRCSDVVHCEKSRADLVNGLARGIGATAAHELGHQAGFGFVTDSACDACYDGRSSTSYSHFFGNEHWSDRALKAMRRVLPPA